MEVDRPRSHNVPYLPSQADERIGDQRTMTPPWNGFGTHNRGRLALRIGYELGQSFLERFRLHVIRISTKAAVSPRLIDRIGMTFSPAAE